MKICDITNFYHEKSGGVKTYIHQKMKYLARYGPVEHMVIVPGSEDSEKRWQKSVFCRVKAPELPAAGPYRLITNFGRVNDLIKQFRPDIIEVGCPYFLPWAIAVRRKTGCRLVGFYHSDFPRACARSAASRIGRIPAAMLERGAYSYVRAMYRCMDLTLAPSLPVASVLSGHGVHGVQVLHLGVDLDNFHPGFRNRQLRMRLGIPPERVLLLFVGRFAREKGLDVLQQAFEILTRRDPGRYYLLMIGEGPLGDALKVWSAGRGDVTVGWYLQQRHLAGVYASADIFVTAGWAETFGLTIIEAQASGLPVVAAASGAAGEALAPAAGVLAEPGCAESLAVAIASIAGQDLRNLGCLARAHMEVHYGWDKTFSRLLAHYERLLRRQSLWPDAGRSSGATGRRIAGA